MRSILAIAMAFVLAAPCTAFADKKKASSGKDNPTESINFNYSKIQYEYTPQKAANPKPKPGVNGGSVKSGSRH